MAVETVYRCDKCSAITDKETMECIIFMKASMVDQEKKIILCTMCSKELEIVMRKWWKQTR